jgi:hypothetical protein
MIKIFYDLETSSRHTIGQILNYTFICVDHDYQVISSLYADVRINRLELPEAGAILANRINVVKHQEESTQTEWEAAYAIREYIDNILYEFRQHQVMLVGFNSNRFDLPFIRTVMIRNGISPYFGKNLINADLYQVVKFLSVTNKSFPRKTSLGSDENKLSLKLETLTKEFSLLTGKQTHNSYDDVKLTIDFARFLEENFDIDLETFSAYSPPKNIKPSFITYTLNPQYDLENKNIYEKNLFVLVYDDYRSSLWLNVTNIINKEDRNPIVYVNKATGSLVFDESKVSVEDQKIALEHYKEYEGLTIKDYFKPSTCDIEQDIYRLDFDQIDYLHSIIWKEASILNNKTSVKDAKILLTRYKLNSADDNSLKNPKFLKQLKAYADYRYGGKLQLWKQLADEDKTNIDAYHPSLERLELAISNLMENSESEDLELLNSLKEFYEKSDIKRALTYEQ